MLPNNQFEAKFGIFHKNVNESENLVKFIHASDTHLGSFQYSNEIRAYDFIRAFHEILDLAINYKVDFILLSGDVFTSLEMLPGKLNKIVEILKEFNEYSRNTIPIVTIEGNHDIRKFSKGVRFEQRGQSWLKLLANLGLIILLDAELEAPSEQIFIPYNFKSNKGGKIKIKNIVIYGTRYLGEKPITQLSKIRKGIQNDDGLFHILLQHFGIEGQMENVPGINIEYIQHLKHRIDYLALGHFHKQFTIDDWIYNPGSSEAVCSIDNSFKRGVFLVEVNKKDKFAKKVKSISLNNRRYQWKTIFCPNNSKSKLEFYKSILQKLKISLKDINTDLKPNSSIMPILYLVLKGLNPYSYKINEKELSKLIIDNIPVVDVKIYQKFTNASNLLDKYI